MATPILATKLFPPPLRPKITPRPRLLNQLNDGLYRKLTLVSAQAGFGKTTVVSQWIHTVERPVGWFSIDERDGDLPHFLAYVVAALETISADIAPQTANLLQTQQPFSAEDTLTTLLNELAAFSTPFILVLDDYHFITAPAVDDALAFLLDHMPRQMHLVIATREDPQLPLSRLRVRGQVTELRVADLRFTAEEAAGFLNQGMGLALSAENIAALEARTEGWIAGLQLAALSMQGGADADQFIQAFTGTHYFILDYLVEEVLQRQPPPVRQFLLQTSLLKRLNGSLCNAVTQQSNGQAMLGELERGNLFVVPLDNQRNWYRYHHLFSDMLQTHLTAELTDTLPLRHQRASIWYEENGLPAEAIDHAFAAADLPRAARLVEIMWRPMDRRLQLTTWFKWAQRLPEEMVRVRPIISLGIAWAMFERGQLAGTQAYLQAAERWLGVDSAELVVHDQAEFDTMPVSIASARAYIAQAQGDVSNTIRYAQQAIDLTPADDALARAIPNGLLGLAHWSNGAFAAAERAFIDLTNAFIKSGNALLGFSATFLMADMRIARGRLREAIAIYQQALARLENVDRWTEQRAAILHLGLSELYREQDDATTADEHLHQTETLYSERDRLLRYRLELVRAQLSHSAGDFDQAFVHLDEAAAHFAKVHVPDARPIAAVKARFLIALGDLVQAEMWQRERRISADDDLRFLHEYEHLTLARLLLAQGDAATALALLGRLLTAAEANERHGSGIEIRLLQALAHQQLDDKPQALTTLATALTAAQPEGYVRLFAREGQSLAQLLTQLQSDGQTYFATNREQMIAYTRQLLAAITGDDATPVQQPLVDPLSGRELDVLRLLTTELTGPQIADELMVSLNTLRTHTKNIYSKLGVNSRRAAVQRAADLALL